MHSFRQVTFKKESYYVVGFQSGKEWTALVKCIRWIDAAGITSWLNGGTRHEFRDVTPFKRK